MKEIKSQQRVFAMPRCIRALDRAIACGAPLVLALVAAIALVGAGTVRANELIRVGKAQATAWTFLPVDVGIAEGYFAKQGLDIEISSLGGDAKLQQALVADSIDIGLGSGPGMAFAAKGSPAIGVAAYAGAPRTFPRSYSPFADKKCRRPEGQADCRFDGRFAQRVACQANGDPGRLGPGWHTHGAARRNRNQSCGPQGRADRRHGLVDGGRLRPGRA